MNAVLFSTNDPLCKANSKNRKILFRVKRQCFSSKDLFHQEICEFSSLCNAIRIRANWVTEWKCLLVRLASITPLIGIEVTEEAIIHFLLVFYVKLGRDQ